MTSAPTSCIRWFNDLRLTDLPLVGGKNASLGEMARELTPLGVRIPDGFAITAEAYRDALDESDAWVELHRALDGLDKRDVRALARAGKVNGWVPKAHDLHSHAGVADLAGLVRTIVLLCALGALFFRSRRFEWLAATIVIIVAVARISSQAIR